MVSNNYDILELACAVNMTVGLIRIYQLGVSTLSNADTIKQQIIQKAWEDPKFKESLLLNPKAAIQEAFGITLPDSIDLVVVEESSTQFYLVIPPSPAEAAKTHTVPNATWV